MVLHVKPNIGILYYHLEFGLLLLLLEKPSVTTHSRGFNFMTLFLV